MTPERPVREDAPARRPLGVPRRAARAGEGRVPARLLDGHRCRLARCGVAATRLPAQGEGRDRGEERDGGERHRSLEDAEASPGPAGEQLAERLADEGVELRRQRRRRAARTRAGRRRGTPARRRGRRSSPLRSRVSRSSSQRFHSCSSGGSGSVATSRGCRLGLTDRLRLHSGSGSGSGTATSCGATATGSGSDSGSGSGSGSGFLRASGCGSAGWGSAVGSASASGSPVLGSTLRLDASSSGSTARLGSMAVPPRPSSSPARRNSASGSEAPGSGSRLRVEAARQEKTNSTRPTEVGDRRSSPAARPLGARGPPSAGLAVGGGGPRRRRNVHSAEPSRVARRRRGLVRHVPSLSSLGLSCGPRSTGRRQPAAVRPLLGTG